MTNVHEATHVDAETDAQRALFENDVQKYHLVTPRRVEDDSRLGTLVNGLIDDLKPVAPPPSNGLDFQMTGLVWSLSLTNDQTHDLTGVLATGAALTVAWPVISAGILAASGYILLIDELGGNNGVDINGVIGYEGVIVTPRVGGFYGDLIQAARLAVSGRTILDFLILASNAVPQLGVVLGIPVVASVAAAVEAGTPFGWALAAALGLAADVFGSGPAPDPNAHGHIWANRTEVGPWESFIMAQVGSGNQVSLLSWQGLFSAQNGGGQDVYANRPQVGDWEIWTLVDNGDGTISLQSQNGNYLSAENGGDAAVYVNRTAIGDWEKFELVNLPDGRVALRTHLATGMLLNKYYVSVQQ